MRGEGITQLENSLQSENVLARCSMSRGLYLPEECEQGHGAKPVQVVEQDWLGHILLPALRQQALQQALYALHVVLNVILCQYGPLCTLACTTAPQSVPFYFLTLRYRLQVMVLIWSLSLAAGIVWDRLVAISRGG